MLTVTGFVKTIGIDSENTDQVLVNLEPGSGYFHHQVGIVETAWYVMHLDEKTRPKGINMLRQLFYAQKNQLLVVLQLAQPEETQEEQPRAMYPIKNVKISAPYLSAEPLETLPAHSIMAIHDTQSALQQSPCRLGTPHRVTDAG